MSLWVDKYRPTSLGKLDYHKEQANQLKNLVRFKVDQHGGVCSGTVVADTRVFGMVPACYITVAVVLSAKLVS